MKIIGHRGARGLAPENTLEGFERSLKEKPDKIEFDVRVTKDGIPVLNHNPGLEGADGSEFLIMDHSYKQLKVHKPDLPTFEEALSAIGKRIPMYIEVKPDVDIAPIVKLIKRFLSEGLPEDHLALASFSQNTLLQLHAALPDTQIIVLEKWSGIRAGYRARQLGTKIICMNQKYLWFGFIQAMRHSGYTLYTYTLNDPAKAKRWAKYGLAAVVTDYPDRFRKAKN